MENPLLILEDILSITQLISRERDLERQLDVVLSAARKLASAEAGCIYLLDKTNRYLIPASLQGNLVSNSNIDDTQIELRASQRTRLTEINSYCALTGQIVNVEDIYQYSGFDFSMFYQNDASTGERTKSLLAIPLIDKAGSSSGVLLLLNHKDNENGDVERFPLELEKFVNGFAALVAISIANARLFKENQMLIKQQEELNNSLLVENKKLKDRFFRNLELNHVVGTSESMKQVYSLIEKVSNSSATVFVHGETGTGKELIATTIHNNSPAKSGRFIAQNCAAFPPDLLESEMFGYKKGAFSGASANKRGLFEMASNGTLFLDEIGEMPMSLQSKLLRALQEGEIRPVGGLEMIKVNVRVIAATNKDLLDLVKEGKFREDLYYRLNVFPINLPPLRERRDDLPELTSYFVDKYAKLYEKQITHIEPKVIDIFKRYAFPGNVRELQNIIERALILMPEGTLLTADCLPLEMTEINLNSGDDPALFADGALKQRVASFEASLIKSVLNESHGNQSEAAKKLGLSRRTLVDKLAKYNLRRMDISQY